VRQLAQMAPYSSDNQAADTAGFTARQDHQITSQPSAASQDGPLIENSKLCLPFGTQDDTIDSTTEDMSMSLTIGKHDRFEIVRQLILYY